MMRLPLITGKTIGVMRQHQQALYAAGLALADPPRMLVLERYNATAGEWETLPPAEVLMRFSSDKGGAGSPGAALETPLEASPTAVSGTFKGEEPFNVKTADRFYLAGMTGSIARVFPARNGSRVAQFILDSDTRGGA